MQTININTDLLQVLNSIQDYVIFNCIRDDCYQITKFKQEYDDESSIYLITFGINRHYEDYLIELSKNIAKQLPQEIQEAFIKEEHLILINGTADTLAIHFNDATITCILHCTGQY